MTSALRPRALTAIVALCVTVCAACSGGGHPKSSPTPSSSTPSPTPSSSASSSAPAPAPKNPYTGIGPVPTTPTIAVKIDDTAPGRPQLGIDLADVVYIEAVEGGLTRLAAIFGTNKPNAVGYVRSTRPSDPDLLLQYGKITEAYSGGAHDSLPRVYASGIISWSNDAGAAFYSRVNRSQSSYINLALNLARVAATTKSALPKSIGWTFNPSLTGLPATPGTDPRTRVTGSYSFTSGTPVEFRYMASIGKYVRYIDGVAQRAADGRLITATNVIIQDCTVLAHPADTDINGNPAQFTYTVGKGAVSVFRQGMRINGTWSRANTAAGTTLTASNGQPLSLDPGNTWVVLVRNGVPILS